MKRRTARPGSRCSFLPSLIVGLLPFLHSPANAAEDPTTVLILVNDAYPPETGTGSIGASVYVGQHYAALRNIPPGNILHLNIPFSAMQYDSNQFISYGDYLTYIQIPVRNFLEQNGLKNHVLYIVPTYGVPVMLSDPLPGDGPNNLYETWRVSVDSILAGMYGGQNSRLLFNSFSDTTASEWPVHFRDWSNPQGWKMYLVTRLDGPTAAIAAGLADKAVTAEQTLQRQSGIAYFDWIHFGPQQGGYYSADQTVVNAYNMAVSFGIPALLNDQSATGHGIEAGQGPNSSWVWGWYHSVVDAYPSPILGAVGSQLTSYSCNSIRSGGVPGVDGFWCPYFLNSGFTATWGATGEPFANLYATGDTLFEYLWRGFTFGESAYLATPEFNWMMVFLGDPLYAPAAFSSTLPVTAPPTNLQFSGATGDTLQLSWSPSASGSIKAYHLDLAADPSFAPGSLIYANLDVGPSSTYTLRGLVPQTSYSVRLRGLANGRFSTYTGAVTGTTPPGDPAYTNVDPNTNLYVVSTGNDRIERFDTRGRFLSQIGFTGSGNDRFDTPVAVVPDASGNLWVTDFYNNQVQKLDAQGNFVLAIGSGHNGAAGVDRSFGAGPGQFNGPVVAAIDSVGNLWVTDCLNHRVQQFAPNGTYIGHFGSFGTGDGQFNCPNGIAFDHAGNIWVADNNNNRVEQFSNTGGFVKAIGAGYNGIPGQVGSSGQAPGQFSSPTHVVVDPSGNICVADTANNRVQAFDSNGNFVTALGSGYSGVPGDIGSAGSAGGQFNRPMGIAFDSVGNVWVADMGNNRVEVFTAAGAYATQFTGPDAGRLNSPNGLALIPSASGISPQTGPHVNAEN